MKKLLKIVMPLLLISIILSPTAVKAGYNVSTGASYVYDIITSRVKYVYGSETYIGVGYEIDDHKFGVGTQVTVDVTSATDSQVDFNISSGGYSESQSYIGFEALGLIFMTIYPLLLVSEIHNVEMNQTELNDEGAGLLLIPFIQDGFYQSLIDMANNMSDPSGTPPTSGSGTDTLIFNATYTQTANLLLCEYFMAGNSTQTFSDGTATATSYMEFDHHYQLAYDNATGVMLGMRLLGYADGIVNGTTTKIEYDQHTERVGYDLPPLEFPFGGFGFTWPWPGFDFWMTFAALTSMFVAAGIVIKRKK